MIPQEPPTRASKRQAWLWFLAVLVVLQFTRGGEFDRSRSERVFNPAFLEALSWWHGWVSLPYRLWDTALVVETERAYNVFPPLQTILAFLTVAPGQLLTDASVFPELPVLPAILFGLPLAALGYAVFLRRVGDQFWAAVLMLGWFGGTALLPCLDLARAYGVHHLNHLLSQFGLLLLAGELLGRRRVWVAVLGLLIAAWSRQLTAIYAVAFLAVVWRGEGEPTKVMAPDVTRGSRGRRLAVALIGLAVIAAVPMALNWAKFGNPLRSGYELIYVQGDTELAYNAQKYGLFSPVFVGRNAYYMNAAVPWSLSAEAGLHWQPSEHGASMWLTTPLLALVLAGVAVWWREPPARWLMLCTVPIVAALLLYHGTGQRQYGYYRFALDFIPVWLVVGARWLTSGRRRYATAACVVWSVAYFALLARWALAHPELTAS